MREREYDLTVIMMCNYVCLPSAKYQSDFVRTAKKCLGTPLL